MSGGYNKLRPDIRELLDLLWNHLPVFPTADIPEQLKTALAFCLRQQPSWVRTVGIGDVPHVELTAHGATRLHDDQQWAPSDLLTEKLGGPPTLIQQAIWRALENRAMKTDALAMKVTGGERARLYYTNRKEKTGGLKELRKCGLVEHKHGLGYYRPDAPPRMDN